MFAPLIWRNPREYSAIKQKGQSKTNFDGKYADDDTEDDDEDDADDYKDLGM